MYSDLEIVFRIAVPSDSLCLSTLGTQVFLGTYATNGINAWFGREVEVNLSVGALSALLENAQNKFILAELKGNLVGFVQLSFGSTHKLVKSKLAVEIDRLYVQEPFTARGIGTMLLRQAEASAAEVNANTIWLAAWVGNDRALRFYAAQGYQDLGVTTYTFEN